MAQVRQPLYFPADMIAEMQREAHRQDRSLSWLVQRAWLIAKAELDKLPSTTDYFSEERRLATATTAHTTKKKNENADEPLHTKQ